MSEMLAMLADALTDEQIKQFGLSEHVIVEHREAEPPTPDGGQPGESEKEKKMTDMKEAAEILDAELADLSEANPFHDSDTGKFTDLRSIKGKGEGSMSFQLSGHKLRNPKSRKVMGTGKGKDKPSTKARWKRKGWNTFQKACGRVAREKGKNIRCHDGVNPTARTAPAHGKSAKAKAQLRKKMPGITFVKSGRRLKRRAVREDINEERTFVKRGDLSEELRSLL